jgi:hypothetical protein
MNDSVMEQLQIIMVMLVWKKHYYILSLDYQSTVGMMYTPRVATSRDHVDSGKLPFTMLIYCLIFYSAHPHHSDRCEIERHSRMMRQGPRARQSMIRRKKRNSGGGPLAEAKVKAR